MFVISWFADGPKWENMVLVVSYPQGLSYFRPFRYRFDWISDQVREKLKKSGDKFLTLFDADALLCAKFISHESVIPIRKIELTCVIESANEYYLYFRVGPLVDYKSCTSVLAYSDMLKGFIAKEDHQKLLHESDFNINDIGFVAEKDQQAEDSSWANFLDLLCRDNTMPLENVRNSFFLRLSGLTYRDTGKPVIPSRVGTSHRKGDLYGYALKENNYYEIELLHRVPTLIGTDSRFEVFKYEVVSPDVYLQISPEHIEMSGNYESHVIQLYAKGASPEGQTIQFEGPKERVVHFNGASLNLQNYHIYYKNKPSYGKWLKKWILFPFIILAFLFIALILRDFETKGWGVLCSPAILGETVLLIILAIVAAIGGAAFWKRS